MKFLAVAVAILLSSCAWKQKAIETLRSWEGRTDVELVNEWGPPDSVVELSNGQKLMTYDKSGALRLPSHSHTTGTVGPGNTIWANTTHSGGGSVKIERVWMFYVNKKGVILDAKLKYS